MRNIKVFIGCAFVIIAHFILIAGINIVHDQVLTAIIALEYIACLFIAGIILKSAVEK